MTFGNALLYSLVGILVVFFALILLWAIIAIMTSPAFSKEKKAAEAAPAAPAPALAPAAPAVAKKLAPGTAGELKLYDTDPRDAAMIMAIIADELGTPLNELRFLSIKKAD